MAIKTNQMIIRAMTDDTGSDFSKVFLKSDWEYTAETPHCKDHGAMLKMSTWGQ